MHNELGNFWSGFDDQLEKAAFGGALGRGLGRAAGAFTTGISKTTSGVSGALKNLASQPGKLSKGFQEGRALATGKATSLSARPVVTPKAPSASQLAERAGQADLKAGLKAKRAAPAEASVAEHTPAAAPSREKKPLTGTRRDVNKMLTGGLIGAGGTYLATRDNNQQQY